MAQQPFEGQSVPAARQREQPTHGVPDIREDVELLTPESRILLMQFLTLKEQKHGDVAAALHTFVTKHTIPEDLKDLLSKMYTDDYTLPPTPPTYPRRDMWGRTIMSPDDHLTHFAKDYAPELLSLKQTKPYRSWRERLKNLFKKKSI